MKWIYLIPISILLLWAKISFFSYFPIGGCRPDLILILCVYISLASRPTEALSKSWYLGLLQDIASCEIIGLFSFIYTAICFFILRFKKEIMLDNFIIISILLFFISLLGNLMHAGVISIVYGVDVLNNFFPAALYTSMLTPPILFILDSVPKPRREVPSW